MLLAAAAAPAAAGGVLLNFATTWVAIISSPRLRYWDAHASSGIVLFYCPTRLPPPEDQQPVLPAVGSGSVVLPPLRTFLRRFFVFLCAIVTRQICSALEIRGCQLYLFLS